MPDMVSNVVSIMTIKTWPAGSADNDRRHRQLSADWAYEVSDIDPGPRAAGDERPRNCWSIAATTIAFDDVWLAARSGMYSRTAKLAARRRGLQAHD